MQPDFNSSFSVAGKTFSQSLFLAPMAGLTHSALRRCIARFGGYGALYTEMLSGSAVCAENLDASPYTKKRPEEGNVFYQLLLNGSERIEDAVTRLAKVNPAGIDLNLGCPAPDIRRFGGGAALCEDLPRMTSVLERLRLSWQGPLFVKCRLGNSNDGWEKKLTERFHVFEDCGVDAVTVHPRFSDEKLKRCARHSLLPRLAGLTRLPIIANGDITCPSDLLDHPDYFLHVKGIMIGRMAAVKPWIFKAWTDPSFTPSYPDVWDRLCRYIQEDFSNPAKALGRIKEFAAYYSRNFLFGHSMYTSVRRAETPQQAHAIGADFLSRPQQLVGKPSTRSV